MASSDDEGEAVPQSVANYHFVDDKDEPVSFSVLPIQWSDDETPKATERQIFLHGTADGLQKIYKQATSWKFDLSDGQPEISVLSKENNWIKLQKPRKSFEDAIRAILITVHCLHFVKKNPETSEKTLWDHLRKAFSLYDVRPSDNDLLDHLPLIRAAVKRDETLAKSKYLLSLLEEKPRKRKSFDEDLQTGLDAKRNKFIVDDDDEELEGDESDEETDLFDSACAICDNGGELLCCEGRCLRSFHATKDSGADSQCQSLGLSKNQVQAIQNFLCKNCQYKQHQCFACGKLGSSDKSTGAEVFRCVSATCGHFYHPECVSKLLYPGNEAEAEELQKKIVAGESFTCPVHKCLVCKQGENKEVHDLQFAVCRRCPKAYHRKCLPRKISFEDSEDEDIIQRAWDDLLPNRILIYCLKHRIDEDLGTPVRNHIIFPDVEGKKKRRPSELQSSNEKVMAKKRNVVSEDSPRERNSVRTSKEVGKVSSAVKNIDSTKKSEKQFSEKGSDFSKKSTITDASRKTLRDNTKSIKLDRPSTADEGKVSLREEKLSSLLHKGSELVKTKQQDIASGKHGNMPSKPGFKKSGSSLPSVDPETEKRILDLIKSSKSSITLEKIVEKSNMPSTHAYSARHMIEKTITQGKVEGFVEAARTALQKLEEGCSIEDVKAVCGPEILNQIIKWKNKLKVYLAPFLHGMRYTSFGRHFTKVDKLKEIVDKLQWYVQNGDMIVDFCCGANDFSCLMKERLEETGKKCLFKNYDVIQPKNDFNFEKRDWMKVRPKELPTGSQLIMGLNPPFGVKAALANKFIDKALEFKPKLLILIVPKETERLDEKEAAYDLVWEDDKKLSGKSFYLPGSIDVNDKQIEQWNVDPPLLYLWSRPDWTSRHKNIAFKQGHISKEQKKSRVEENQNETPVSDHPMEVNNDYYGGIPKLIDDFHQIPSSTNDLPAQKNEREEPEETRTNVSEDQKESSPPKHDTPTNRGRHEKNGVGGHKHRDDKKKMPMNSKERQDNRKQTRAKEENPPKSKHDSGRPQASEKYRGTPPESKHDSGRPQVSEKYRATSPMDISPIHRTGPGSFSEGHPSEELEIPSERAVSEESSRLFQPGLSASGSEFVTGYGSVRTSIPTEDLDDISRKYSANLGDPFSSGTHRWSTGTSLVQEYGGVREQFPGYIRDSMDNFSERPYINERDDYRRDSDIRLHLRLYGQQNPDSLSQSSTFLRGQDSGFGNVGLQTSTPYGLAGSVGDSSYSRMSSSVMQNSSALQRYAPRLDELNHTRMSTFGSEMSVTGRSGVYDLPGTRTGFHGDSMGFAPGPQRPFPNQNSSGWLNE